MSYTKQTWQTGDTITAEKLNHIEDGVDDASRKISDLQPVATSDDVGKALFVKTVDAQTGKPSSYKYGEVGGGLSPNASRLLMTILDEAVYGSDQSSNLALLREELLDLTPVSIEAEYDGEAPLVGTPYASLDYTVTVTYDDSSEAVIDDYTVLTTGNVVSGTNTVTISYKEMTTTCTFTASTATVYTITYNLTHVSSSSSTAFVESGSYYNTVLAVDTDYDLDSVTVTMGGVDVTSTVYSNLEILIPAVTGNVVITTTATQITYLDPLRRNYSRWTYVYDYSDDHQTEVQKLNTNYTTMATEYPALNDCTLHWQLKNITESDISLTGVGFGSVNCVASDYRPTYNQINVSYFVAATTQSGNLSPGQTIEGTVTVKAGWQLIFQCHYLMCDSFEIKIYGNYTADTFSSYTKMLANNDLANYGKYRTIIYYSDNGTTELTSKNAIPKKLSDALEAGTYDLYYCVSIPGTESPISNQEKNSTAIGPVDSTTDTASNYAWATPVSYIGVHLWYHGQITVGSGQTVIVWEQYINNMDGTTANAIFMLKKVVTP